MWTSTARKTATTNDPGHEQFESAVPARGRLPRERTRKILIHAINFAPELIGCAKYTTQLARYLEARGHDVEVVTAPPHYPGWFVRAPYRPGAYQSETIDAIRVTRCPMIMKTGAGGLWRLLSPLSFAASSAPVIVWKILRQRPDVLLCVEPTLLSAPLALLAAKIVGARSILHVQDLEVDAAFELGHLSGAAIRAMVTYIERRLLRGFTQVIAISEKMREALLAKGLRSGQVATLRNWVDLHAIVPRARREPNVFRTQLRLSDDAYVILYSGHIGIKQALDVVMKAASLLIAHDSIRFVIAGEGPALPKLQDEFANLHNVVFIPLQPIDRFSELLAMADLHVLPQHRSAADLVLPSKLGGMLASGRPIVATAAPGTEIANLLTGIALLSPPGDDDALARSILLAHSRDLSVEIERGLSLAETLSATRLLPTFETLLIGDETEVHSIARTTLRFEQ
jgi:colanic acid biosynthesis glycosyl transferase WcaI